MDVVIDVDVDADADVDVDEDVDADVDEDEDVDVDVDVGVNVDAGVNVDVDADADAESDVNSDVDAITEVQSEVPTQLSAQVFVNVNTEEKTKITKGFTIIEVVIALLLFCIFFTCILSLDSTIFRIFGKSKARDVEYNIARSICEKFKSENGQVEFKKVVLYLDNIDDISLSISDLLKFSIEPGNYSYDELKSNNLENKKYVAIVNCFDNEYLYFIEVNSFAMTSLYSGVKLRTARYKNEG